MPQMRQHSTGQKRLRELQRLFILEGLQSETGLLKYGKL
jgi:hypothetical protein